MWVIQYRIEPSAPCPAPRDHGADMPVRLLRPSGPRGISPPASHRSGLDTLASSGSCHRTKAAAFRRELELLLLPVGSLPTSVTCPLRSTSITPASSILQGSPPLSGASVLSASRLEPLAPFPLASPARF